MLSVTMAFLRSENEFYWLDNGRKVWITPDYMARLIDEIYQNAGLNPGWGSAKEATKKWLPAGHTQSVFWKYCYATAVDKKTKKKTHSIGWLQPNSQHWANKRCLWYVFCREQKLKSDDPAQLWGTEMNFKFAAWYNQFAIDHDLDTYHFNRTPAQKKFYRMLMAIPDDETPWETAENQRRL